MISFAKRNIKIYFKDKTSVFFSLLAVFIMVLIYVFFLRGTLIKSFSNQISNVELLVDWWIAAGMLSVASVTTTLGAFGILIDDKTKKSNKDFIVSPISNKNIIGGYILSSVFIGIIMSVITLVIMNIYIALNGGDFLNLLAVLKILGIIALSTVANSAILLLLVSSLKNSSSFSTASSIIGTAIGFVVGAYIPIGSMPETIRFIVKCCPASHTAVILRQIMTKELMADSFKNVPSEFIDSFKQTLGITFKFGSVEISMLTSVLVLVLAIVLFYGLAILKFSFKKK